MSLYLKLTKVLRADYFPFDHSCYLWPYVHVASNICDRQLLYFQLSNFDSLSIDSSFLTQKRIFYILNLRKRQEEWREPWYFINPKLNYLMFLFFSLLSYFLDRNIYIFITIRNISNNNLIYKKIEIFLKTKTWKIINCWYFKL